MTKEGSVLSMGRRRGDSTLRFDLKRASQLTASSSSTVRRPGTMVMGMRKPAAGLQSNRRLAVPVLRGSAGCQHQDRDARLLLDQRQQLVAARTLPDIDDRDRAGDR